MKKQKSGLKRQKPGRLAEVDSPRYHLVLGIGLTRVPLHLGRDMRLSKRFDKCQVFIWKCRLKLVDRNSLGNLMNMAQS